MSSKKSEQTRTRILNAAWKLLNSAGDETTRMADVAKEAGVSRQTVYLHFPNRAELLVATTRHIDEVEDVAGQIAQVLAEGTGRARLETFVRVWCSYIPVVYGGAKGLLDIKDTDADADAAWQDRMKGLHDMCEFVVESLASDTQLAAGVTRQEAADLMWAVISVRQWELLTIDRKMTQARYEELTLRVLVDTLVRSEEVSSTN